jgi:hypothetical protein
VADIGSSDSGSASIRLDPLGGMAERVGRMAGALAPVIFVFIVVGFLSIVPVGRLAAMALAPEGAFDLSVLLGRLARAGTQRAILITWTPPSAARCSPLPSAFPSRCSSR